MTDQVYMLASCRKPELLASTLLVFKTFRVGFPSARLTVFVNAMPEACASAVGQECDAVRAESVLPISTVHDQWIERLIQCGQGPFWICDTDLVFLKPVEGWFSDSAAMMSGRWIPTWDEEWTKTRSIERLHTCLMYLDPVQMRDRMREWCANLPRSPFHPRVEFIRQHYVPGRNSRTVLYDTMAGAWHALGGTPFTAEQDAAFEHLNCGTYADLVAPHLKSGPEPPKNWQDIFAEPKLASGLQAYQKQYYAALAPKELESEL